MRIKSKCISFIIYFDFYYDDEKTPCFSLTELTRVLQKLESKYVLENNLLKKNNAKCRLLTWSVLNAKSQAYHKIKQRNF